MKTCNKCLQSKPESEFYHYMKHCCKECHRTTVKAWDAANRPKKITYNREWVKRNPLRKRLMLNAHQHVLIAVRQGRLTRPTTCPICHQQAYCEASHSDYNQVLNVAWKCRSCHRIEDSKLPKTRIVVKGA